MCLALENWLFLRKNGFLLAIVFPLYRIKLFFLRLLLALFGFLFACICFWVCVLFMCIWVAIAIKYSESQPNRSLCIKLFIILYLKSFGLFPSTSSFFLSKPHSSSIIIHILAEERKKFDYKTNRFLCLFCDVYLYICLVTRDNFMGCVFWFCSVHFSSRVLVVVVVMACSFTAGAGRRRKTTVFCLLWLWKILQSAAKLAWRGGF